MNIKTPLIYAALAALYIICIVLGINSTSSFAGQNETILIPMAMLSLFVLSAALMGFLFVSEPLFLFLENKKKEAVTFFLKTIGFFVCFAILFGVMALFMSFV